MCNERRYSVYIPGSLSSNAACIQKPWVVLLENSSNEIFPISDISILSCWISNPAETEAGVGILKKKVVKQKWKEQILSIHTLCNLACCRGKLSKQYFPISLVFQFSIILKAVVMKGDVLLLKMSRGFWLCRSHEASYKSISEFPHGLRKNRANWEALSQRDGKEEKTHFLRRL